MGLFILHVPTDTVQLPGWDPGPQRGTASRPQKHEAHGGRVMCKHSSTHSFEPGPVIHLVPLLLLSPSWSQVPVSISTLSGSNSNPFTLWLCILGLSLCVSGSQL